MRYPSSPGRVGARFPLAAVLLVGSIVPVACALQTSGSEAGSTGAGLEPATSGPASSVGPASGSGGSIVGTMASSSASGGTRASTVGSGGSSTSASTSSDASTSIASTAASTGSGPDAGPIESCLDHHQANPAAPSGVYSINPKGNGAFDVYCDMTDDGGGWTLVLKTDGDKLTFRYSAPLWTDTSVFGTPALDQTEAKLASYHTVPAQSLRVGMYQNGAFRWLLLPMLTTKATLFDLIGTAAKLAAGVGEWQKLFATPYLQTVSCAEGFSITVGAYQMRIGIVGDNIANCGSPNSWAGFGSNQVPSCGDSSNFGTSGANAAVGYVMVR